MLSYAVSSRSGVSMSHVWHMEGEVSSFNVPSYGRTLRKREVREPPECEREGIEH